MPCCFLMPIKKHKLQNEFHASSSRSLFVKKISYIRKRPEIIKQDLKNQIKQFFFSKFEKKAKKKSSIFSMQDNFLFNAEQSSLKMHSEQSDSKPFSNARPFFIPTQHYYFLKPYHPTILCSRYIKTIPRNA